jgi:hypothetical protein
LVTGPEWKGGGRGDGIENRAVLILPRLGSPQPEPRHRRDVLPLQNRVDPFGEIRAVPQRGLFTGNRGVIHDPDSRTLLSRRWATKAWLICVLEFQNRDRDVMGRNGRSGGAGWTELFFLDEVTALAAGHRPCFHCQRERARAFLDACDGAPAADKPRAPRIDAILHTQRTAAGARRPLLDAAELARLPDGAMVARDGRAFAVRGGHLLGWSFAGYVPVENHEEGQGPFELLTPELTLQALERGYEPVWHETATIRSATS